MISILLKIPVYVNIDLIRVTSLKALYEVARNHVGSVEYYIAKEGVLLYER